MRIVLGRHTCCRSDSVCLTCWAEVVDSRSVAVLACLIASASAAWDCVSRLCRWTNSSSSAAYKQVSTVCNLTSISQTKEFPTSLKGLVTRGLYCRPFNSIDAPHKDHGQMACRTPCVNRNRPALTTLVVTRHCLCLRQQSRQTCIRT